MGMDNKLKLAIGFNVIILLLILIIPNLPERHMFEIQVEPKVVRLGTEFSVKIKFEEIPTSCILKIVDGATNRVIESREFASVSENSLIARFFANEEIYPIGLQIARVEANYGGKKVVREAYFPVSTGVNISAVIDIKPSVLRLRPGENATVDIKIRVCDELNRSVSNAMVWIWTDDVNVSVTPNMSKTDINGETSAVLYLPPGNYTQVIVHVTAAKRGHPVFYTSFEIPILREK